MASNSDAEIIDDLLSDGVESEPSGYNEGYAYDLEENTKYTVCVMAVDANNKRGKLVKKEITTKSSQNQPMTSITINSASETSVNYSTVKNSYCSSYVLKGWYNLPDIRSYPDILWAYYCYEDYKVSKNIYTQNRINTAWNVAWKNDCMLVTLGFNSSGVNSGVISKQYFSVSSNKQVSFMEEIKLHAPSIQKGEEKKANIDKKSCQSHKSNASLPNLPKNY